MNNKRKIQNGIIIVNYNTKKDTVTLVDSLLDYNYPIVIVDNDSFDGSLCLFKKHFVNSNNVYVINSQQNTGYAKGNNIGIKFLQSIYSIKFLTILNPDVRLSQGFINRMIKVLEKNPDYAMITGVMKDKFFNFNYTDVAWKLPDNLDDFFLNSYLLTRIFRPVTYNINKFIPNKKDCLEQVDCIPGSCFIIRYDIFKEIGYFDDNTFLYCEERILAKKIKNRGYKVGLVINEDFIHNHESPKKLINRLKHYFYLLESRIYYLKKYTNHGKYLLPIILFSVPLGLFEIILICLIEKLSRKN